MAWNVTMLFVCVLVALALGTLYRNADNFQRLINGLWIVACLLQTFYYAASVLQADPSWMWMAIGRSVAFIGVVLHVARIFLYDQERRCLPSSQYSKSRG